MKGEFGFTMPPPRQPPVRRTGFRIGLRSLLAMTMGGLGLLAAAMTALALGALADQRLRNDIGAEFTATAERLSAQLDRGLFERMREIQIIAALPAMRRPEASREDRRAVLGEVQRGYPDYAILMFIDPTGRVVATSNGLLEEINLAHRSFFRAGIERPFLGDVHDAELMSPLLGRPADDPARFIDLSAPVRDEAGHLVGVIAAHVFWEWAGGIAQDAMLPLQSRFHGATPMVLTREGKIVLGRLGAPGRQATLREVAPQVAEPLRRGQSGSLLAKDAEKQLLIGYAPSRGYRGAPALGWSVLVRGDADAAFARARQLRWRILGWGSAAALLAAALGWWLAGRVARPLEQLSQAALHLRDDPRSGVPAGGFVHEAGLLSDAFASLHSSLHRREQELAEGEARLRAVLEQMPVGVVLAEMPAGRLCFRNARAAEILGRPLDLEAPLLVQTAMGGLRRDGLPYEPDDLPISRALRLGESVIAEPMLYRRGDGQVVWLEVSAAPVRGAGGQAFMVICTFDDVTGARLAAEQHRILAREVDHRAKNALAVVQAALRLTQAETTETFVRTVEGRVAALARAQIRLSEGQWRGADLRAVLEGELAVLPRPVGGTGVQLLGPPLMLRVEAVQPLCMVVHELATNATRHGALSVTGGRVMLSWEPVTPLPEGRLGAKQEEMLHLRWIETEGPVLNGAPARRGFGARVIETTLKQQLGGSVRWEWRGSGLCCDLLIPIRRAALSVEAH